MVNSRVLWADYAKAIGIILVVYGHVARGLYNAKIEMNVNSFQLIDSIIYSFHMPFFFFLSGLFFYDSLQKRTVTGFLANKFDTLVYIYIVWSLIQDIIQLAFNKWTNNEVTISEIIKLFSDPRGQFWFLYALTVIIIFSTLVYRRLESKYFIVVFILGALALCLNIPTLENLQMYYIKAYFVFFAFGVYFKNIQGWLYETKHVLIVPLTILTVALHWMFQAKLELGFDIFGSTVFLFFLALSSIIFIVLLSMVLAEYPITLIKLIGTSSMVIYLVHIITGSGIRILLQKIFGIDNFYIHMLLGLTFGVFGSMLFEYIANKIGFSWLFKIPSRFSLEKKLLPKSI